MNFQNKIHLGVLKGNIIILAMKSMISSTYLQYEKIGFSTKLLDLFDIGYALDIAFLVLNG